jgi:secondary thiamine-phosphate synthase enzyme
MSNTALSPVEHEPSEQETMQVSEGAYKVASATLTLATSARLEFRSITREVAAIVAESPVRHGLAQISSLHTTAGVLINETQGALLSDIANLYEQLIPRGVYYKHNDPLLSDCDRKNADAHLRAVVTGLGLTVPVVDGKLKLGTWQNILLAEFDGPGTRKIHVQVMGV